MNWKDNTALLIAGIVICVLAAYFLLDMTIEKILIIFGLGGGAAYALKKKADNAKTIADEHENLMQYDIKKSNDSMNEAVEAHKKALDAAEDITPIPNDKLPPGFKPRNTRTR